MGQRSALVSWIERCAACVWGYAVTSWHDHRRAGKDLNRASLQKALEGMQKVNIGGLEISCSTKDHTGLDYAELSIIGADGRLRR